MDPLIEIILLQNKVVVQLSAKVTLYKSLTALLVIVVILLFIILIRQPIKQNNNGTKQN